MLVPTKQPSSHKTQVPLVLKSVKEDRELETVSENLVDWSRQRPSLSSPGRALTKCTRMQHVLGQRWRDAFSMRRGGWGKRKGGEEAYKGNSPSVSGQNSGCLVTCKGPHEKAGVRERETATKATARRKRRREKGKRINRLSFSSSSKGKTDHRKASRQAW